LLSVRDFTLGYGDCQAMDSMCANMDKVLASLLTSTCFHTTIFAYSEKESRLCHSDRSEESLPQRTRLFGCFRSLRVTWQ
jgi:hypothetical protein